MNVVYESVKKAKNVRWIIRKYGEGRALFFPAPGGDRYKNLTERDATRLSAPFSLSSFIINLWLARIILGTNMGREYLSKKF